MQDLCGGAFHYVRLPCRPTYTVSERDGLPFEFAFCMDSDTHEGQRLPLLTLQCARVTESFIDGAFESDLLQEMRAGLPCVQLFPFE